MAVQIYVYDAGRTYLGLLPDFVDLSTQTVANGAGVITFRYPANGKNANLLSGKDGYLGIAVDGVRDKNWYVFDDDADDPAADEGDSRWISVSGSGVMSMLARALVYPGAHSGTANPDGMVPTFSVQTKTPGWVLKTLIDRAKGRGGIPDLLYSFNATTDSNGAAWTRTYSATLAATTSLYQYLLDMVAAGLCDVVMDEFTLHAYINDTVLTTTRPNVFYRSGQNVQAAPVQRSRRDIANVILGLGADKKMVEVKDTTSISQYGRREAAAEDGRVTQTATMLGIANKALADSKAAKEAHTLTVPVGVPPAGESWPVPGVDFLAGNYIYYDRFLDGSGNPSPVQVKSITWTWQSTSSEATCALELADRFTSWRSQTQAVLDSVTSGSVVTAPPVLPTMHGTGVPNPPTSVAAVVNLVAEGTGWVGFAVVTWTAPVTNTDGSAIDGLAGYEVEFQYSPGGAWGSSVWVAGGETVTLTRLVPGSAIEVRVRAKDKATIANYSDWAVTPAPVPVGSDTTPPAKPSTPTVSTRLGTVTVKHDGLDSTGAAFSNDFSHLMVHVGTTTNFTPTSANLRERITGRGGQVVLTDLAYGTTVYVKVVAYDTSNNASTPSNNASVTPVALVNTDVIGQVLSGASFMNGTVSTAALADGSISAAKLVDGAVVQSKIAADAVGANQIAANAIVAGKIAANAVTAGTIAANAVTAGTIAANAVTTNALAAGSVTAEALAVNSVTAEKIGLGVLGTNRVPDPSFEDPFTIDPSASSPKNRWRTLAVASGGSVTRVAKARSGLQAVAIASPAAGVVTVASGVFPVEAGKTYYLTLNIAKLDPVQVSKLSFRIAAGSSTALTQYPATTSGNAVGFETADVAGFGEDLDAPYSGDPPLPAAFATVGGSFVVPAGMSWAAVVLCNNAPTGASTVIVDDVAVTVKGEGASEVTSAGIRLFDSEGDEVAAFVANRTNYFTITKDGQTLAAVTEDGSIAGSALSVASDPIILGSPLVGKQGNTLPDLLDFANEPVVYARDYSVEPLGIIEQYAKGTVAWAQIQGSDLTQTITANQEMSLFELGFDVEPGRQYTISCSPILLTCAGNGTGIVGLRLRYTADGSIPSLSSSILTYSYTAVPNSASNNVSVQMPTRLYNGGATTQSQLKVLFCIFAGAGVTSAEVYASHALLAHITDLGPVKTLTGTIRNYKTGGTTSSSTQSQKVYVKTYTATGYGSYRGDGSKRTDRTEVVHGYDSYNGMNRGLWVFPGMTSDLAGATITKIEVFAYATHWYYNNGGTARITLHGYSSVPGSSPTLSYIAVKDWTTKTGGLWVTLPSSCHAGFQSGSNKGFGMGPAVSNSNTYYGRFMGPSSDSTKAAKVRITYKK